MQATAPERRAGPRARLKVIHQHRVGRHRLRRVSELVYLRGRPFAVLDWVDLAGVRAPLYLPLDAGQLRAARNPKNTFLYDGETFDPRFD